MSLVMYTVKEVAKITTLSVSKVYSMIEGKEIPSITIGNRVIVPAQQLELYLNSKLQNPIGIKN